jgi:hypothetical protein
MQYKARQSLASSPNNICLNSSLLSKIGIVIRKVYWPGLVHDGSRAGRSRKCSHTNESTIPAIEILDRKLCRRTTVDSHTLRSAGFSVGAKPKLVHLSPGVLSGHRF